MYLLIIIILMGVIWINQGSFIANRKRESRDDR
jgi:hypothetical protein